MNKYEIKSVRADIWATKRENIEEVFKMAKYCLSAYMYSLNVFGLHSGVTKGAIYTWKDFLAILKEEKNLMHMIVRNADKIDKYMADEYLDMLDDLNDDTFRYYCSYLDSIENACDMKTAWRAKKGLKEYDTLIETNNYRQQLVEMMITKEDIMEFMSLPNHFWNFIKTRTIHGDDYDENDQEFYGINVKCDHHCNLIDIKLIVPKIINLKTALINVHEYQRAYELYKLLGHKFHETMIDNSTSKEFQKQFKDNYMTNFYSKFF